MRLAVFDVDGTLTDTNEVDGHCYAAALERCFGFDDPSGFDWAEFEHVTDPGIVRELFRRRHRRWPKALEIDRFREVFVLGLRAAWQSRPETVRPMPGAHELLAALSADADWRVAIATGGFHESALLKLGWAGFQVAGEAVVSAGHDYRREVIFGEVVRRSEERNGQAERVVLVGDGVWDVRTAARLGYGFVGVARGARRVALERAGAEVVVEELGPARSVLELLRTAPVPRSILE